MKQKTFWILFVGITLVSILLGNTVFAQDSTKVNISTVYNDVKHGINVNAPKIEQALGTIARDLKVTADQVWNILVKQQKVWSICFLLLTISCLTNWFFWYKFNFIRLKENDGDYVIKNKKVQRKVYIKRSGYNDSLETETDEIPVAVSLIHSKVIWFKYLHLIICLTLSLFSYLHFGQMLTGFMNPEYGAMQTIAEVAKSLK